MDKLSWETIEYFHTEKTSDWYWIVGIISVSIAVIAVILNNIIFGILVIVSAFTLSLFASRRPNIMRVSIDGLGVTLGKTRYPYKHLESFWIETREVHPKMILKSEKTFMPFITAFIEEVEPEEIRGLLLKHLPEEEHIEPFLERLMIHLGF